MEPLEDTSRRPEEEAPKRHQDGSDEALQIKPNSTEKNGSGAHRKSCERIQLVLTGMPEPKVFFMRSLLLLSLLAVLPLLLVGGLLCTLRWYDDHPAFSFGDVLMILEGFYTVLCLISFSLSGVFNRNKY